jgi:ubiquinone/menaquinone biosynthesis C-methylase UbiE
MPKHDAEAERVHLVQEPSARRQRASGLEDLIWLCAQAEGETLEIGIGRGRTLAFYPPGIRLHGLEIDPRSLEAASRRAAELGLAVELREGDAERLPYPEEHFDTVVFCFSLCTIPDDRRAIAEAARVLRCRGRLLIVEHVRSSSTVIRAVQRLAEPLTVRIRDDHLTRDPLEHVLAEELEVEYLERRRFGLVERIVARKPESEELEEAV